MVGISWCAGSNAANPYIFVQRMMTGNIEVPVARSITVMLLVWPTMVQELLSDVLFDLFFADC